jgi:S-adenosylmethionine-diacylglycerol 3-amino-3-carboxypropyl transferase
MAESEIAARAAFDLIRYGQVWEDADVLLAGLRVKPGETVVSIASAGDNALALLTADPGRVIAIDLSQAQINCLELRRGAYRALDHQGLLELMGSRPSSRRGSLLDAALAAVPDAVRNADFWQDRRAEILVHGLGGIGKFESYFRLFRTRILPLVHSRRTIMGLLEPRAPEERRRYFDRHWNTWAWRALLRLFFSRAVMGRLGRDPSFFTFAEGSLAAQVAAKTRQALTVQDPSCNPYLAWILTGTHGRALPLALRPEHFETIRGRLHRIELLRAPIETFVRSGEKADAFNLSDIFEYMSEPAFEVLLAELLKSANPGARLVYWNMMVPRTVPEGQAGILARNVALENELKPIDKAFFYSDLVVAELTP